MTAVAQVRHILIKDIREARWLLVVYVALVALATLRGAGWMISSWPGEVGFILVIAIVLAAAFAAASVVQADSPTRHGAFWTRLPVDPLAMLGAKMTFVLVLVGIGVAGQSIGVAGYGIGGAEVATFAGRSALAFGVWLLFALLLAAVLPDFRAFSLAFILIPIVSFVLVNVVVFSMMAASTDPPTEAIPGLIPGLGVRGTHIISLLVRVGSIALMVWLYRTRDVGRRVRAAGLLLAASLFVPLGGGPVFWALEEQVPPGDRLSFTLTTITGGSTTVVSENADQIRLSMNAPPLPPHLAWAFARGVVVVGLHDGSRLRVPLRASPGSSDGMMPRLAGVRWLDSMPTIGVSHHVFASLTDVQQRAIVQGIASIALEGEIHLFEAVGVATLPLIAGSEVAVDGRRIRLDEWRDGSSGPAIGLRESTIGRDPVPAPPVPQMLSQGCALVNRVRGEALVLSQGGGGSTFDGLVLPGTPVRSGKWRCERTYWNRLARPTNAWFRDAELAIVLRIHRGSYPLRLELPR